MALYRYQAVDRDGKRVKGTHEAVCREAALDHLLSAQSLFVTTIEETAAKRGARPWANFGARVGTMDLVLFYRRLSTLIASDIPIVESLNAIETQTENQAFGNVVGQVKEDVRHGKGLSEALAKHPRVFPEIMVSMVRVGETGGILPPVLDQLAEFTERDNEVRTEVKTALAYPAVVLTMAAGTVAFLMLSVVPRLTVMFEGFAVTLPWPTRVLMAMSNFVGAYGFALLAGIVVLLAVIAKILRTPKGREGFDAWSLRAPLYGRVLTKTLLARFSRSLGALLQGGVPLMEALDVVKRVLGNVLLTNAIERVKERVRKGESLGASLRHETLFPEMVKYMITSGEDTGKLDEMLHKVASVYEMESRQAIKITVSLLPPILILLVAAVVGFIAFAMLLPIFQINQMMG